MRNKDLYPFFVIALSGKKGSGKDTVADMLQFYFKLYHGEETTKHAFADPVRKIAGIVASVDDVYFEDRDLKEQPIFFDDSNRTPRDYLRLVGQALKSAIDEDIWVRLLGRSAFAYMTSSCIVTDVRFRNELDFVKENGAFVIKIERDDNMSDNDVSETEMDSFKDEEFDLIIKNNGTREELSETISNFVKNLKIK